MSSSRKASSVPRKSTLVAQLAKLPPQNWLISVAAADRTFTPYLPPQQIRDAFDGASPSAQVSERSNQTAETEIRKLTAFSGRRILLVLKSKTQSTARASFVAPAVRARVPVYIVDGGEKYSVTNRAAWGFSFEPSGTIDDSVTKRQRYLKDGIIHEIDLPRAIRHIASDSASVLHADSSS